MENRENIVADYFKLRTLLNRTNFKSNEKTDIEFTLRRRAPDNFYFAAELKGIRNPNKIELCQKNGRNLWQPSNHSGLFHLEEFCANFFRKNISDNPTDSEMKSTALHLHNELRSLGISK